MLLPPVMIGAASTGTYPHHAPIVGTNVGTARVMGANALKNTRQVAEGMGFESTVRRLLRR